MPKTSRDCSELDASIAKLAQALARHPDVKTFEDVVRRIRKMAGDVPLSRQDIVDSVLAFQGRRNNVRSEADKKASEIMRVPGLQEGIRSRIEDATERLKNGESRPTREQGQIQDEVIQDLRSQLRELSKQESMVQNKEQVRSRISELVDMLESGDYYSKPKPERRFLDEEHRQLVAERDVLQGKIRSRLEAQKPLTWDRKLHATMGILNTFQLGGEWSSLGLQGGRALLTHPVTTVKAFWNSFDAWKSESGQAKIEREIAERPNYRWYELGDLALTDYHGGLSRADEQYIIRIGEKIKEWSQISKVPGANKIGMAAGEFFDKFNRQQVTFLNQLRADLFDMYADQLYGGELNQVRARDLSGDINTLTGRGDLGSLQKHAGLLSGLMLAPRLYASHIQTITGYSYWRGAIRELPPAERAAKRKFMAKRTARALTSLAITYALTKILGGDWEENPLSSDFGKVRFGNRRVDIPGFGPAARYMTLLARMATGYGKSTATGEFYDKDRLDSLVSFFRARESTAMRVIDPLVTRKNAIGQHIDLSTADGWKKYLSQFAGPISYRDIYDVMTSEDMDIPRDTAISIVSLFGANMGRYANEQAQIGEAAAAITSDSLKPESKARKEKLLKAMRDRGLTDEQILRGYEIKFQDDMAAYEAGALKTRPVDRTQVLQARLAGDFDAR